MERIMLDAEKKAERHRSQAKDYIAPRTKKANWSSRHRERANEVISSADRVPEELRTSSVTYATDVL